MIKWFRDKSNIAKKTAGLEEKKAAMQKKIEVAMSILERRQEVRREEEDRRQDEERRQSDIPILIDRRKHA